MSHNLTKLTIISAIAVSISGCSQISKIGDGLWGHTQNAWGYTKSAANFAASPVTKLLRSTPEQQYVFEDASRAQNMAKQAFISDSAGATGEDLVMSEPAQLPVPQTPKYRASHYQGSAYAPRNSHAQYDYQDASTRQVAQAQAVAPAVQTTNDISFVKVGGGSNMQDWLMCEAEAGGFVRVVQGGYLIDPGFERCMRTKGYKPESEVADVIANERSL